MACSEETLRAFFSRPENYVNLSL